MPRVLRTPEYYFMLEFSNKDTDANRTNCEFNLRFVVHLHGLPVDAVRMSLLLVLCCIGFICLYTVGLFICWRKDSLVLKKFSRFSEYMNVFHRIRPRIKPQKSQSSEIFEQHPLGVVRKNRKSKQSLGTGDTNRASDVMMSDLQSETRQTMDAKSPEAQREKASSGGGPAEEMAQKIVSDAIGKAKEEYQKSSSDVSSGENEIKDVSVKT